VNDGDGSENDKFGDEKNPGDMPVKKLLFGAKRGDRRGGAGALNIGEGDDKNADILRLPAPLRADVIGGGTFNADGCDCDCV